MVIFNFTPDIENGSNTFVLAKVATGTAPTTGTDIDVDNNGVADAGTFSNLCLLDAVGVLENDGAANVAYASDFGGENLGPFTGFNPDAIYRLLTPDGAACAWLGGDILGTPPATGPFPWDALETFDWNTNGLPDGSDYTLDPGTGNLRAPSILTQPENAFACVGGSSSFSVESFGGVSFQWRFEGEDLDGETGATLTIDPVSEESFGDYDVVLTGPCGVVISSLATLSENFGDDDGDGVSNCDDLCPGTPAEEGSNSSGCSCSQQDCSDSDSCTDDSCLNGECLNIPIVCDDFDACTIDTCEGGFCFFTPVDCNDNDDCTLDFCQDGVCQHNIAFCDDGDPCTNDACVAGLCIYVPIVCDDGDLCTIDSCVGGLCLYSPFECVDNDPCVAGICVAGVCVYVPVDSDGDGAGDCIDNCPSSSTPTS